MPFSALVVYKIFLLFVCEGQVWLLVFPLHQDLLKALCLPQVLHIPTAHMSVLGLPKPQLKFSL